MAPTTNLTQLTRSHNAISAKKRAKHSQLKEILFDDDARHEFLTGFHKRKLAKAEAAKKKALDREKQEHLEFRREQRRTLRERAIQNATEVEQAYGALLHNNGDEEEEWNGIDEDPTGGQEQAEYEDDEHLATVTVIEDFDPHTLIHGSPIPSTPQPPTTTAPKENQSLRNHDRHPPLPLSQKTNKKQKPTTHSKQKLKPSNIRYETKDARRLERTKQRARRTEKAELAGGKGTSGRDRGKTAGGRGKGKGRR